MTRRSWGPAHLSQLAFKWDYFSDAWGDGEPTAEALNDMRLAYQRHGDEIEEIVRRQHGVTARSWASKNLF